MLCICGVSSLYRSDTESYIDADEIYYQYYMKHVEGPLTHESVDWLSQQQEEFRPIYQLNAALMSKKVTSQEYQAMMQGYSSLQQKMNVFQRVIYKAQMLKENLVWKWSMNPAG